MIGAQHAAASGQGVLVEGARLLTLTQFAQVGGEVVGRGEGVRMIGAQHVVEAGEGVVLNLAGPLMFPQRPQDHAEVRGRAQ